jgi:hypothetical protein
MRVKPMMALYILMLSLMLSGCGVHYMVKGQVIDAVTKQPIEGAVVAIEWYRIQWAHYLVPLTSGNQQVANADDITGQDGSFSIPKYHHITTGGYFIGIYKEGYICWNNEDIFIPEAPREEKKPGPFDGKIIDIEPKRNSQIIPRKDAGVFDGMVIELEPIKKEGFPVLEHARFVSNIRSRVDAESFYNVTEKEREFESEYNRRNNGVK